MHDDDFNAMTKCVDCPSGETSTPQSTGCEEPDDFWDKLLERLTGALGVVAAILAAASTLREFGARDYCGRDDCGKYKEIDRGDSVNP